MLVCVCANIQASVHKFLHSWSLVYWNITGSYNILIDEDIFRQTMSARSYVHLKYVCALNMCMRVCISLFECAFTLTLLSIYFATTFCCHVLTALTCPTCNTYADPNVTLVRTRTSSMHSLHSRHKCTHISSYLHSQSTALDICQPVLHCCIWNRKAQQSLLTSRRNHTHTPVMQVAVFCYKPKFSYLHENKIKYFSFKLLIEIWSNYKRWQLLCYFLYMLVAPSC